MGVLVGRISMRIHGEHGPVARFNRFARPPVFECFATNVTLTHFVRKGIAPVHRPWTGPKSGEFISFAYSNKSALENERCSRPIAIV